MAVVKEIKTLNGKCSFCHRVTTVVEFLMNGKHTVYACTNGEDNTLGCAKEIVYGKTR